MKIRKEMRTNESKEKKKIRKKTGEKKQMKIRRTNSGEIWKKI